MTGHCPSQLMSSLATVLNMVTQDEVGEGVQEKHNRAMTKIRALGEESVRVIVKNVQEEVSRIPGAGVGTSMILI